MQRRTAIEGKKTRIEQLQADGFESEAQRREYRDIRGFMHKHGSLELWGDILKTSQNVSEIITRARKVYHEEMALEGI